MTTASTATTTPPAARFALFDLDNTLVSTTEPFHEFVRELMARYELPGAVDEAAVAAVRDRIEPISWREFAAHAEEWYGITTPPAELLDWVLAVYPTKFVLDPRVAEGLDTLHAKGWKLGIVTNGTTAVQQAKIDTVGLRRHVDFIIDSDAAGVRKPDRRIFEVAAEGLGVELGPHGWMVGDNHANDIVGGHGVGLRTIWLPYGAEQPGGAVRADHACATILEAFEVIGAE